MLARGKKKTVLIILDGWGIGPAWGGNAIMQAKKPNFDLWWRTYPHSQLQASGIYVGLPDNTGGNSETGHLNIGAGRIIPQDLPYINKSIEDKSFFKNEVLLEAFTQAKKRNKNLHLIGLVGDGHVHSDLKHLFALLKMAKDNDFKNLFLDLFTDGRDSEPNSALSVMDKVENKIKEIGVGKINFISGRAYGMDRNKNWGRTSRVYNALTKGEAEVIETARECISRSYLRDISDEFIEPRLIAKKGEGKTVISDGDSVIFFNFRPDRARQISAAFTDIKIKELADRKILKNLYFATFVSRDPTVYGKQAFAPDEIKNTLPECLSKNNLKQLHVAETEKYAHVTYFFDGGREKPWPGEYHHLVPSPKVLTYDMTPRMSADKITDFVLSVATKKFDFIVINYANADMVGHTGNFQATVQTIEAVDENLGKLIPVLLNHGYYILITADHGNAEEMLNAKTYTQQTEHTSNPVPLILITKELELAKKKLNNGILADIAPTILALMGIEKPKEMTGNNLILNNYGQAPTDNISHN